MNLIDAVTVKCAICGNMFSVCHSCWRGQKFCSSECRLINTRQKKRIAQRKYAATKRGLENGRARQRRRYNKSKDLENFPEENSGNLPH